MTIPTSALVRLATLTLSAADAEVVAAMLSEVEAATRAEAEPGKEKARARWRKWKEGQPTNASKRLPTATNVSKQLVSEGAPVEDKPLTQKIEPQEESKKDARDALRSEFDREFWPAYPHKVGKPKAFLEFVAARKRAELSAILEGLARYVADKPLDRAWLNPATFLHQDRFSDQPATPPARAGPPAKKPHLSEVYAFREKLENEQVRQASEATVLYLPASSG